MVVGGGEALQQAHFGHDVGDDISADQCADFADQPGIERRTTGDMQGAVSVELEGHKAHRHCHPRRQQRHGPGVWFVKGGRRHGDGAPGLRQRASDGGLVDDTGFEQQRVEGAAVDELLVDGGFDGVAVDVDAGGAAEQRTGKGRVKLGDHDGVVPHFAVTGKRARADRGAAAALLPARRAGSAFLRPGFSNAAGSGVCGHEAEACRRA